jgi:hypothetical protein
LSQKIEKSRPLVLRSVLQFIPIDLLPAVEGPQLQIGPPALQWVQGFPTGGARHEEPVLKMESADDPVAAVTDGQEVFESQPKEIIPAVAFDEIIRVRVVVAGTFVGKLGVAVDKRLGILEIPHRDNRIHEQPLDGGHLQVPTHYSFRLKN